MKVRSKRFYALNQGRSTILDITLETIPANITKLMHVDKTIFVTPSSPVNEWRSYECPDEGTHTQKIHNSSTRSHPSKDEIAPIKS
jgi:hypothetical protein